MHPRILDAKLQTATFHFYHEAGNYYYTRAATAVEARGRAAAGLAWRPQGRARAVVHISNPQYGRDDAAAVATAAAAAQLRASSG